MTLPYSHRAIAPLLLCLSVVLTVIGAAPALGGPDKDKDSGPPAHSRSKKDRDQPRPEPSRSASEQGSQQAPDPGSSPGSSPRPASGNSNQPSPAPSPHPGGPGAPPGNPGGPNDGSLAIEASSGVLLGQVGEVIPYTIRVSVEEDISRLVVTAELAPELEVAAVPMNDEVEAISSARRGPHEDIVWVLEDVAAGSAVDLTWSGRLTAAGDLEATTIVEARAQETSAAAQAQTFIAATDVQTEGVRSADQVLGKVIRRVPVVRQVAVAAGATGAVLPVTGWSPEATLWVAFACMASGLLLLALSGSRGPGRRGALILVLIVFAGCTVTPEEAARPESAAPADSPEDQDAQTDDGGDAKVPPDRVKGKIIYRNPKVAPGGTTDAETTTTTEPPAPTTQTEITYRRVVELVPGAAPAEQAARDGDNVISFQWDEGARTVTEAASSLMFTAEQTSSLTSSLASDRDGLSTTMTLENTSEAPLRIQGELVLTIMRETETVATLTSPHIDVILGPEGSVRVTYRYLLPSSEYLVTSKFQN